MTKDSRDLEILVAKIQKQLSPDSEVLHDVRLPGRNSGVNRQIDVLVRQKIGQYEMLIVLDCKDYKKPVDVKGVEEFHGLLRDVGAHRGSLVCPAGFSAAAKTLATSRQIDLFSPIDTDPHKWQVRATAPTVCDFRSAQFSFGISCSAPLPFMIPPDFWTKPVIRDKDQNELGSPIELALKKWNAGSFPTDPGVHMDFAVVDTPSVLANNGYDMYVPVKLTASVFVERKLYYGQLPVPRISGFKDELSGKVITNAFTVGILDPAEVEREWLEIKDDSDLPMPPLLTLVGLLGYENVHE